jgi:hypothetical protein
VIKPGTRSKIPAETVKKSLTTGFQATDALFCHRFMQPVDPGPARMPQHGYSHERSGKHQDQSPGQAYELGDRDKRGKFRDHQRYYGKEEPLNHYRHFSLSIGLCWRAREDRLMSLWRTLFAPAIWRRA